MSIEIEIFHAIDATDYVIHVDAQATILHSPREGYDPAEIAALERDLGPYISKRLNDALKKGGAA